MRANSRDKRPARLTLRDFVGEDLTLSQHTISDGPKLTHLHNPTHSSSLAHIDHHHDLNRCRDLGTEQSSVRVALHSRQKQL
jgi:hypothetical protein